MSFIHCFYASDVVQRTEMVGSCSSNLVYSIQFFVVVTWMLVAVFHIRSFTGFVFVFVVSFSSCVIRCSKLTIKYHFTLIVCPVRRLRLLTICFCLLQIAIENYVAFWICIAYNINWMLSSTCFVRIAIRKQATKNWQRCSHLISFVKIEMTQKCRCKNSTIELTSTPLFTIFTVNAKFFRYFAPITAPPSTIIVYNGIQELVEI